MERHLFSFVRKLGEVDTTARYKYCTSESRREGVSGPFSGDAELSSST
jgi:hypothetical protein